MCAMRCLKRRRRYKGKPATAGKCSRAPFVPHPSIHLLYLLAGASTVPFSQPCVLACQAVCSPTRAAIMTGRYSTHTGIHVPLVDSAPGVLPNEETLIPQLLKQAGYVHTQPACLRDSLACPNGQCGRWAHFSVSFLHVVLAYVMHIARTACTMRCVVPLLAGTQLQWWVNGILGSARGPTPPLSVGSTPFSDITQVPQTTSRFNPCAGKKYEQSGKALSIYVSPSVSPSPPSRLSLVSRFYCI